MYKYQDFKDKFGDKDANEYLVLVLINVKKINSNKFTREQAISGVYGDSWMCLAALDRLVELGLVNAVDKTSSISNHWIYKKGYLL
jgi:hypothetical protein